MILGERHFFLLALDGSQQEVTLIIDYPLTTEGSSSCRVIMDGILESSAKICGVDPIQATGLAIKFQKQILLSKLKDGFKCIDDTGNEVDIEAYFP